MDITLKAARINRNLTQREAASLIGIRKETLAKYEKGQTFPNIPILKRIEEVYGVEYKELIFIPDNYPLRVDAKNPNKSARQNKAAQRTAEESVPHRIIRPTHEVV